MPPRRSSREPKSKSSSRPWDLRDLLRSPTALVMAAGLVLPNLLSIATLGSILDVSLPPRTIPIMAYAMLAVCARRIPYVLTIILFLAILAFDLIWTISVSFGLAPSELVTALDHARHVHVLQSPLYGALIGVLVLTSAATLWLLHRREILLRANIVVMFAAALAFSGVDFVTNVSPHYQFGTLLGRNVPIESAASKSGFNAVAGNDGRPVMVVATLSGERHEIGALMVAALGQAEGWRVVYLGPDLPADEVVDAARRTGARMVALSLVYEEGEGLSKVAGVRSGLPPDVDVVIGGPAATGLHALTGVRVFGSSSELRRFLSGGAAQRG